MKHIATRDLEEMFLLNRSEGKLYWKQISKYHKGKLNKEAGTLVDNGKRGKYWVVRIDRKPYKRSHIVYALVNGRWASPMVDHINGNSLDDRPENLREADYRLNNHNHRRRNIRKLPSGNYLVEEPAPPKQEVEE